MKKILMKYGIMVFILSLTSCISRLSPEEEVRNTFEAYMKEMQTGNSQEAVRNFCRGKYKETTTNLLGMMELMGEKTSLYKDYTAIQEIAFLPDYSDVAIVLANMSNNEPISFILHFDNSESWKIYYAEASNLILLKNFINGDHLSEWEIFTISDSDMEDLETIF
ncbi:hypothetical protein [Bacteroides heparinolyticus]|nr:hypothetical protein [Bacteroides heparinolyticus]